MWPRVDLTIGMLAQGHRNVAEAGLSERVQLVNGRAEQLPFPDASFDALTFTYLLRYVDDPQATLTELARVVKPGGAVASLEFYLPPSRFWRAWWWLYTRFVLPAGVPSRPLPRPQHRGALQEVPPGLDGGRLAPRRVRERGGACHEPRRWPGDVGHPERWMTRPARPA
jgi:SAM-dependent methyltransferase